MSDLVRTRRLDPLLAASLLAGAASGAIYFSLVLSFAFLIPLQMAFGRFGRRAGFGAALTAALAVVAIQAYRGIRLGGAGSLLNLILGMAPPLVLIAALAAMNAAFWARIPGIYRILALVLAVSLLAAPGIAALKADAEFRGYLEARIQAVVDGLTAQPGSLVSESYEVSALKANLNPATLVGQTLEVLASSFSALIFLLIGGSWWMGNRASGEGSLGRAASPALAECRLPYALVWPFLASWAAVFAAVYLGSEGVLRALAWNVALVLSLAYAAQGIGIASHYLKRWNTPRSLRFVLAGAAIAALATPLVGTAVAAILPLLGFTEVWIPYRNLKGVGA